MKVVGKAVLTVILHMILTGTFTFGGGDSKAELDEIIRPSLALWTK